MDALAEANADAKDVDEAIRIGGDVALGIGGALDDAEIEAELEKLALEAESEKVAERLGSLPRVGEVPSTPEPERVLRPESPLLA